MNFGQNLYQWFLSNAQSLVLMAIGRFFKVCVWYVVPDLKRCDETTERT